jgi:hypothetical protein
MKKESPGTKITTKCTKPSDNSHYLETEIEEKICEITI